MLHPNARFRGDVNSAAEFFRLFGGLGTAESYELELRGIGTGARQEILAFDIEVESEDEPEDEPEE